MFQPVFIPPSLQVRQTSTEMGCFGFLKIMMFIFNGIIFLAGAAILGVGIWVKVDSSSILGFLGKLPDAPSEFNQVLNVGYLLIAIGALLVLIGFLGCCGASKENKCMLLLFFIIILLVFIAEVAGAIVILAFRPLVDNLLQKASVKVVASIQMEYGKNPDLTGLWNSTMTTLQCCGFNNYSDFNNSDYYNKTKGYPPQCCSSPQPPCNQTMAETKGVIGCFSKFKKLIDDNSVVIVGVALGIAALEICAMVVSMFLYCRIRSTVG
uniref:Tetraspanin n=1 Tax=Oryzias latipes TaxID=8090 RepID=A0A3P9JEY0_ORYLA